MAQSFTAGIYGEIKGNPPYAGTTPFSASYAYSSTAAGPQNFAVANTNVHPISPGQNFNGVYCYSVIEEFNTGTENTNQGKKYAAVETLAALVTLRNA